NRLLFRAARGIVGDDAEAQDAVQETYLRAFLALDAFRGESTLATWLVRIAINQALGQQRKLGRLVYWDEDPGVEESDMSAKNPADSTQQNTPEDEAARNELRHRLEQAIDLLPPIYRCVFLLRAVQGLSVEDTAASLQVSQDVVKTRYLRARGLLRTRLGGEVGETLTMVHEFQGRRCDDTVRQVLASLRAAGVIRDQ
ncbi:MAG: RNA polymerase sigma factor, partial [Variovorax sp.]